MTADREHTDVPLRMAGLFCRKFFFLLAACTALIYCLFFLSPPELRPAETLIRMEVWAKLFLSAAWLAALVLTLSALGRLSAFLLLLMVLLPSAVFAYMELLYAVPCSYGLIANFAESGAYVHELVNFIDAAAVGGILCLVAASACLSSLGRRLFPHDALARRKPVRLLLLLIVTAPVALACGGTTHCPVLPVKKIRMPLRHYLTYVSIDRPFYARYAELEKVREASTRPGGRQGTTVFLHIGESLRADHVPMNGYRRNTMPVLQREASLKRLFSFRRAVSFSIYTRISVLGITTPATIARPAIRHRSFVPLLNENDIATRCFFSRMDRARCGHCDTALLAVTGNAVQRTFTGDRAASLLGLMRPALAAGRPQDLFCLYYGEGSHTPYTDYDAERYGMFKPVSRSAYAAGEARINNYDNCIRATDDFAGKVLAMLQERSSVYIYAADHGDFLGENGRWGRSGAVMNDAAVRYVAFFIWVSDRYRQAHPDRYRILAANHKRLHTVSHDHVYHTVLGLYGIRTGAYQEELDLFSCAAADFTGPFPRELPAGTQAGLVVAGAE